MCVCVCLCVCVCFCVSWSSSGARTCIFLFPAATSTLSCYKSPGLLISTGFVYKHHASEYRAFSVLGVAFVHCLVPRFRIYICEARCL